MKILNRPMFRMGGPIKEGIMNGIQEPRRIGYAVKGTVSAADQAKAFENIFTTPNNVTQEQVTQFANRGTPNLNIGTPKINSFEKMKTNNQFGNQDPTIVPNITIEDKIKSYTPNPENPFKNIIDYTKKVNTYVDENGVKRSRNTGEIIRDTDISEVVTEPRGPQELGLTTREEIKPDIPEANERALTKKERTNNILEMLGYDKAKKNALYDAMINAGQRISRTGLGADNLVSDVIADTSRSYDKPEKLREAANLMDVQQQLKLDQIDASKTGGSLKQNYDFYKDQGYDNKTAERMAKGLPVTITEKFNASKATSSSGKVYNVTQEIVSEGFFGKDKEYKGKIDTSDHKNLTEFLSSEEYKTKGDGVYNVKGEAVLIENGVPVKRQIIQPQSDKKGWFS